MPEEAEFFNTVAISLAAVIRPDITASRVQKEDLVTRLVLAQIIESKTKLLKPNECIWIVDFPHTSK